MDYHTAIFSSKEKRKYRSPQLGPSEFSSPSPPSSAAGPRASAAAISRRSWTSSKSWARSSSTTNSSSDQPSTRTSCKNWPSWWRPPSSKLKNKNSAFRWACRQTLCRLGCWTCPMKKLSDSWTSSTNTIALSTSIGHSPTPSRPHRIPSTLISAKRNSDPDHSLRLSYANRLLPSLSFALIRPHH